MDIVQGFNTKTALEHLVFLSGQNIVEVCRTLAVTPQQFSDWIKKRRPVPEERLKQLSAYFGVPAAMLADEHRYALGLSRLNAIELEMLVVAWETKMCTEPDAKSSLAHRSALLEEERQKQLRIARLAALLERNEPALMARIDRFLNELEQEERNN
jgi:hypothetical protein